MVVGPDGIELVVGSSGSNRLRSAITQVAINVVDHGMGAAEASITRASTSRATGSTARAASTRPSSSCLSTGASA